MLTCPKCNKKYDDEFRFCNECGTDLIATAVCANCGLEVSAEYAFCEKCGSPLSSDPASKDVSNKVNVGKKTGMLLAIGGVVAIAILILLLCLFSGGKNEAASYGLYLKDNEIFYSNLKEGSKPIQITSELFADGFEEKYGEDFREELAQYIGSTLSDVTGVSANGSRFIFPDKLNYNDNGFALYNMTISGEEKNDTNKIGSDIDADMVAISEDLNIITYVTDYEGSLYQYDVEKDEKTKIAVDVAGISVSKDGKILYYINDDDAVYVKCAGKDREKISGEDSNVVYISEDYSTAYIMWEESLYKCQIGKEKEKIASDVNYVLKIYESGEMYYLSNKNIIETALWDYVTDDYGEADAAFSEPERPEAPKWYDYVSDAQYDAAYESYEQAYANYEKELEAYKEKEARDEFRKLIDDESVSVSLYSLCYFDGNKETTITDVCSDMHLSARSNPVIIYGTYNGTSDVTVKLSDYSYIYDIKTAVESATILSYHLAVEGNTVHEFDATDETLFRLNDSGTTVSYINRDENSYSGDLYKMTIKGDKVSQSELYDSDVYCSYMKFSGDDQLVYYKNDSDALYIDGKEVALDVDEDTIYISPELNGVLFLTEEDDEDRATLKLFRDDIVVKISDDVSDYSVAPDGRILYLYDYSWKYYKGELRVWDNGDTHKVDDDVICIIKEKNYDQEMQYAW